MTTSDLQKRYFSSLKEKYKVDLYRSIESDEFLYLILRKANLGISINDLEVQWLAKNRLSTTINIILLEQYQADEPKRLKDEFLQLRAKYLISDELKIPLNSPAYSALWKLEAGIILNESELGLLKTYGLEDSVNVIHDSLIFSKLKTAYKATHHIGQRPTEPLYSILKKIDSKEDLLDEQLEWLVEGNFRETLEIYWQQFSQRKLEAEFLSLKSNYGVESHPETSVNSLLYTILKKLAQKKKLTYSECAWLSNHKLNHLIALHRQNTDSRFFEELKHSYNASQYTHTDSNDPLFLILKKLLVNEPKAYCISARTKALMEDARLQLSEADIQWLNQQGLADTAKIARKAHFDQLKRKYRIVGQLEIDPFYEIMLKLEREERLDPLHVVQLIEKDRLSPNGEIVIAHYRLEAIFYESEFQRTKNFWHLASASSNWRKADQPKKALEATADINWARVKEADLKAALYVTRGAAFRDISELDHAENYAARAITLKPDSYQPYTLMGAVCYDRGNYAGGDRWFEQAITRGAKNVDDEIRRIVQKTKDKKKRREIALYLLGKDKQRYRWAAAFSK